MTTFRSKIHNFIGEKSYEKLRILRAYKAFIPLLVKNFTIDIIKFSKHSTIFKKNTFNKIEAMIILKYHSLEKGFLHDKIRFRFGRHNIVALNKLLKDPTVIANNNLSQIAAAYNIMCKYYVFHKENNIDISDYFKNEDYLQYVSLSQSDIVNIKEFESERYFEKSNSNFDEFSNSRSSVRSFKKEIIPIKLIKKVIDLAKNAPSVCNRQPVKVYYVDDKEKIDAICDIQGGLVGYSENLYQLLVVVSDRSYFYTVGERNQLFIDGGIFLMNLLYALHFYEIGACPAHWGLNSESDIKIKKILNMKDSEKVISLVAIGVPEAKFKTCGSLRRETDEILIF